MVHPKVYWSMNGLSFLARRIQRLKEWGLGGLIQVHEPPTPPAHPRHLEQVLGGSATTSKPPLALDLLPAACPNGYCHTFAKCRTGPDGAPTMLLLCTVLYMTYEAVPSGFHKAKQPQVASLVR